MDKFFRSKEINGRKYQIAMMPALKALGMAKNLSKVILPAIGGTVDGLRDDGSMGVPTTFTDLAITICTQLDDIDFDATIFTLTKDMTCDGKEVKDLDTHFQGELGELLAVVEFALKENFSSFFTGSDMIAPLKKMMGALGVGGSAESESQ